MDMKRCSCCGFILPVDEFYAPRAWYCKSCSKNYTKNYLRIRRVIDAEFRKQRNEYSSEYIKRRRKVDPEFRHKMNISSLTSHVCKILDNHSKELKDDPEHLSTEFIIKLCRIVVED